MTEHTCRHEVDLALLQKDTAEIKVDVKKLVTCVMGNGKNGLVTKQALSDNAIKRIYLIFGGMWAVGLIVLGVVVRKVLT